MYYAIRHVTRFRYSAPISESVMEVKMQPRTEGRQRCLSFHLSVVPRARVQQYRDHLANTVHHFDIPGQHTRLTITAEALVEMQPFDPLPEALPADAWDALDVMVAEGDYWEMLLPSQYVRPSNLLYDFAEELNTRRRADPLTLLHELNAGIYDAFSYVPQSTKVDSPIDDALRTRQGVCQDYAHVMIAMARTLKIPCRYVSGYLFHHKDSGHNDRSVEDATHAWVEALLPGLGWVGFDPTNNLIAAERHIRTAVGRDYADVPPTRGVFKGVADTELHVAVAVAPTDVTPSDDDLEPAPANWHTHTDSDSSDAEQMQMQQQ